MNTYEAFNLFAVEEIMAELKARKRCYIFTVRRLRTLSGLNNLPKTKFKVRCKTKDEFEAVEEKLISMYLYVNIEDWFKGEHLVKTEGESVLAFSVKLRKVTIGTSETSFYFRVFVRSLGNLKYKKALKIRCYDLKKMLTPNKFKPSA
ncbi:hypothetical protein HNY73_006016 [Argiope bruennichi]|uniref:Uncharacterized protein n=1 Tax=Argiope bruennichi TaxID=94029 RepID=A0A8T0FND5_ARGBR|nr:hypothetical protein HNY73_006016 [Argiope bruennichi]